MSRASTVPITGAHRSLPRASIHLANTPCIDTTEVHRHTIGQAGLQVLHCGRSTANTGHVNRRQYRQGAIAPAAVADH